VPSIYVIGRKFTYIVPIKIVCRKKRIILKTILFAGAQKESGTADGV
jgi:hypothetical protein